MWRLPQDSVLQTFSSRALTLQDQSSIIQFELNWVYQLDVTRGKRENSRSVNYCFKVQSTANTLTNNPLPPSGSSFLCQQTLNPLTTTTSEQEQQDKVILGSNTYSSTIFIFHNHFCYLTALKISSFRIYMYLTDILFAVFPLSNKHLPPHKIA